MFRVRPWAPPMAYFFVVPCSRARRAAWTQQRAQCFACDLGRPVGLELCKTVFRGSPCCLDTTTRSMFRVRPWAPPLAWNFVKPCSGARRAAWTQQHASRATLGAPVELNLRGAVFRGSPCCITRNVSLENGAATRKKRAQMIICFRFLFLKTAHFLKTSRYTTVQMLRARSVLLNIPR
jgi:hypothetical protein